MGYRALCVFWGEGGDARLPRGTIWPSVWAESQSSAGPHDSCDSPDSEAAASPRSRCQLLGRSQPCKQMCL